MTLVASFAVGLRETSRIKMIMSGTTAPPDTMLLATIADGVRLLLWSKTKDAEKGKNRPASIVEALRGRTASDKDVTTFASGEDFKKERLRLLRKGGKAYGN